MNPKTKQKPTQRLGPQALEPPRSTALFSIALGLLLSAVTALGALNPTYPSNQVASLGATVTHQVRVTSATPPYAYQWFQNDAPLVNATNGTLILTNLQSTHAGAYFAVVTDATLLSATSRVATLTVDVTFLKVTGQPIAADRGQPAAAAWCDYDSDGAVDVYVANSSDNASEVKSSLYHNEGDGTFTRVTNSLTSVANNIWGSAWGDYDNDGHADLLRIQWGIQPAQLYRNGGGGAFGLVTTFALVGEPADCAWTDWDRDGWLDLFIGTWQGGVDLAYRNLGNRSFLRCSTNEVGSLVAERATSASASFADFDNDGDPDVYVNREDGAPSLHRNLGTGKYEKAQAGSVPGTAPTTGGLWADVNNDGFFDLLTTSRQAGLVLHLNVDGREFETSSGLVPPKRETWGPAWGDFDNDGDLDLFIPCYASTNMLFVNNGDATFISVDLGSPMREGVNVMCAAWVDYDNDGFLDLFVTSGLYNPSPNLLYRNNLHATGNRNHWLKVCLTGTASNRSAIGAKIRVRVVIGGRETWQLRQIASNGSWASGGEFVAHFGLGDATNVDEVRIEWPSSIVQTLTNVTPAQMLTVVEHQEYGGPLPTFAEASKVESGFRLAVTEPPVGMVYVLETSTNLATWTKLMSRPSAGGTFAYTNTTTTTTPRLFYRVLVP